MSPRPPSMRPHPPSSMHPPSMMRSSSPEDNFKQELMQLEPAAMKNAHLNDSDHAKSFDGLVKEYMKRLPLSKMIDAINECDLTAPIKSTMITVATDEYQYEDMRSWWYCCKNFGDSVCRLGKYDKEKAKMDALYLAQQKKEQ